MLKFYVCLRIITYTIRTRNSVVDHFAQVTCFHYYYLHYLHYTCFALFANSEFLIFGTQKTLHFGEFRPRAKEQFPIAVVLFGNDYKF